MLPEGDLVMAHELITRGGQDGGRIWTSCTCGKRRASAATFQDAARWHEAHVYLAEAGVQ